MKVIVRKADRRLSGTIDLAGSKSIANRVLIIRALCAQPFPIHRLADAKDTQLLDRLLQSQEEVRDAGPAGTTFRFLTAYLSLQPGVQILTGTERMKQRPIGLLVEALRRLGARIDYLEREGFPPLRIGEPGAIGREHRIRIPAGTSSQFISALLLIAPALPQGLELTLEGKVVSRPYIEMTLHLMQHFGVKHTWMDDTIAIPPQSYQPRAFTVEADWSAASYYYALAAFAEEPDLHLAGLFPDSLQGDSVLAPMMRHFGIETTFTGSGIHLHRSAELPPARFEWDFLRCPDLAQTLAVICGGLGVPAHFTGVETLRIKETDRIAALRQELAKVGVALQELSPDPVHASFHIEGRAVVEGCPTFATYEDHRMAMAFAPLALLGDIAVEHPAVVEKSYPDFWIDLASLGFEIAEEG